MNVIGRREFLLGATALAGLAALAGCDKSREDHATDAQGDNGLAALVLTLFPHQGVASEVYADVAERARKSLEARVDWDDLRQEGASLLESIGTEQWAALDDAARAAFASAISDTRFFKSFYQAALPEFYSHPDVWRRLGYPGESASQGGYLHRGFDNIDWLPEDQP